MTPKSNAVMAKIDSLLRIETEESIKEEMQRAAIADLEQKQLALRVGNVELKAEQNCLRMDGIESKKDASMAQMKEHMAQCEQHCEEMCNGLKSTVDQLAAEVAAMKAEDAAEDETETEVEEPEDEGPKELNIDVVRGVDNRIRMMTVNDSIEIDVIRDGALAVRNMKVRYIK